jgi:hypothetical protein
MRKGFALVLILVLTVSSLILVKPEHALASITKPSVPEFTVRLIDNSYDVPMYNSTDPYTGANVTHPAQHIDNRTLEFRVKNQPFTPYYDASSSFNITLYYNVRMKGHYAENWTNLYSVEDDHPRQSNSDYTLILLPLGANSDTALRWLPSSTSQVDFQVESMIGYFSRGVGFDSWSFTGEESGWSNTQTLTIPANESPSPTSTPITPEFPSVIIVTIVLIVLALAISVFKKKAR